MHEFKTRPTEESLGFETEYGLQRLRNEAEVAVAIQEDDNVGNIVRQQPVMRLALPQLPLGLRPCAELPRQQRREQDYAAHQDGRHDTVLMEVLAPPGQQVIFR